MSGRSRAVVASSPPATLKSSRGFLALYRQGRWAHGPSLSVGWMPNGGPVSRVGIRTRKGMRGAVVRNRLKRQLRAILRLPQHQVRQAVDVLFVLHPSGGVVTSRHLEAELLQVCHRAKLL